MMPYSSSANFITAPHSSFTQINNNRSQNISGSRSSVPIKFKTLNNSSSIGRHAQRAASSPPPAYYQESSSSSLSNNVFNLSNSDNELSLFSSSSSTASSQHQHQQQQHHQQDQNTEESFNISSSLPSTISSYLAHLDTSFLGVENFNILDTNVSASLQEKNEQSLSLEINSNFLSTSQATAIMNSNSEENNNSNNSNNNNTNNNAIESNNDINKESYLFNFDDVNLATPTTESAPMLEQHTFDQTSSSGNEIVK